MEPGAGMALRGSGSPRLLEKSSCQVLGFFPSAHEEHPGKQIELYGGYQHRKSKGGQRIPVRGFHKNGFLKGFG
jgi:hypothetical protein